jgi:hypothetical protein
LPNYRPVNLRPSVRIVLIETVHGSRLTKNEDDERRSARG